MLMSININLFAIRSGPLPFLPEHSPLILAAFTQMEWVVSLKPITDGVAGCPAKLQFNLYLQEGFTAKC